MVPSVNSMFSLIDSAYLLLNTVPPIRQPHSDLVYVLRVALDVEDVGFSRIGHWLQLISSFFSFVNYVLMVPDHFLQLWKCVCIINELLVLSLSGRWGASIDFFTFS